MASSALQIVLQVRDNASKQLDRAGDQFERMEKSSSRLRTRLNDLRLPLLAVAGTLTAFGLSGIKAASDLEQSIGAVKAVFGEASGTILAFGETAVDSLALSQRAFNEAVTPFGAMMKNAGVEVDIVADRMIELSKVAADMAATHGGTVKDAINALSAAFRGEADPIEQYGLSLKITDVNARAMAMGLADSKSQIDATSRAAAFMDLVLEQTADIQGQFARETGTVAQETQRANAEFEEMRAELGERLRPHVLRILELLNLLLKNFNDLPKPAQDGTLAVLGFVGAVALLGLVLGPILTVVGVIGGVGLAIVAALAVAGGAIALLWTQNEDFRDAVIDIWDEIKKAFKATVDAVTKWWDEWGDDILATLSDVWGVVKDIFNGIVDVVEAQLDLIQKIWDSFVGDWIRGAVKNAWGLFVDLAIGAWEFVSDAVLAIADIIKGAINIIAGVLTGDWERAWDGAKDVLKGFVNFAFAYGNAAISIVEGIINAIFRAINALPDITIPDIPGIPGRGQTIGIPEIPDWTAPRIPALAEGGIVNRPTLAMIGEAGPEAVIPLGQMGGNTFNITINGNVDSPARAEQMASEIARLLRVNSRGGIPVGGV